MRSCSIICIASIVICAAANNGDARQNKINTKGNVRDIDEEIYPAVEGDLLSKNKNQQTLEAFLQNVNLYTNEKKSPFQVCTLSKQEEKLTKKLVKLRRKSFVERKKNHQRCLHHKGRSTFFLKAFSINHNHASLLEW